MRREVLVLAGLAALLLVAAVVTAPYARRGADDGLPALSTHSTGPHGAQALKQWLAGLGFAVDNLEYRAYVPEEDAGLLFILNPTEAFDDARAGEVINWVRRGGTLVLAVEPAVLLGGAAVTPFSRDDPLLDRLEVELRANVGWLEVVAPRQPVLHRPLVNRVSVRSAGRVSAAHPSHAIYLGDDEGAALVGWVLGAGRVYVAAMTYPFSNQGIGQEDNWRLVLNLLADVPPGSRILFDEYHHGFTARRSFGQLLFLESWGLALLYAVGLAFLWLALRGRRFGRAIPGEGSGGRSIDEYVYSLAGMLRRARARDWLVAHTHSHLKLGLGRAYGVAIAEDDDRFAEEIGARSGVPSGELRRVLADLRAGAGQGETEAMRLADRAARTRRLYIERSDSEQDA